MRDEVWINGEGQQIPVNQIPLDYLRNILRWIIRKRNDAVAAAAEAFVNNGGKAEDFRVMWPRVLAYVEELERDMPIEMQGGPRTIAPRHRSQGVPHPSQNRFRGNDQERMQYLRDKLSSERASGKLDERIEQIKKENLSPKEATEAEGEAFMMEFAKKIYDNMQQQERGKEGIDIIPQDDIFEDQGDTKARFEQGCAQEIDLGMDIEEKEKE